MNLATELHNTLVKDKDYQKFMKELSLRIIQEIETIMHITTSQGQDSLCLDLEKVYYQENTPEYSFQLKEFLLDCYLEKEYTTKILHHFEHEGFRLVRNYNCSATTRQIAQLIFTWR